MVLIHNRNDGNITFVDIGKACVGKRRVKVMKFMKNHHVAPFAHPTQLTNPNGLVISYSYTPRGWLSSKTIDGHTTQYTYFPTGLLNTVTTPAGVVTSYQYDPAHRLTDIIDAQSNKIHYTLDNIGNRTQETITDAQGHIVKTHSWQFDALSRLQSDIGAYNQTTKYQYDANGICVV